MESNLAVQIEPQNDEEQQIRTRGTSLVEAARDFTITDNVSYEAAGGILRDIKTYIARAKEFCRPNIKRWHDGWKKALEDEKNLIGPYEEAERLLKPKMVFFYDEQERKRREEEARAQEAARKRAEEEQLRQAVAAEQSGQKEAAELILSEPAPVPTVIVPKVTQKVEGVAMRTVLKFKIVNDALIPREFLMVDEAKIRKFISAMGEASKIPGVEIFKETAPAVSGRR